MGSVKMSGIMALNLRTKMLSKMKKSAGIKIQQRMKWNDENKEITYDNETN